MIYEKRTRQEFWLLTSGFLESQETLHNLSLYAWCSVRAIGRGWPRKAQIRCVLSPDLSLFWPPGQTPAKESVHPNGLSSLADSGKVQESSRPALTCTGIGVRTMMSRLYVNGGDPLGFVSLSHQIPCRRKPTRERQLDWPIRFCKQLPQMPAKFVPHRVSQWWSVQTETAL